MEPLNRRIDLQTCRDQHDALRELIALFPRTDAFDATEVAALVERLGRILIAHLRLEDGYLYPVLASSSNRAIRDLAAQYREEMGNLRGEFEALASSSSKAEIAADPAGFFVRWEGFRAKLETRMSKEDHGLYAVAEEFMTGDAAP